tara:strand:- start:1304 stop:1630 length:327 start_codon:yes stop_codon:yes gene_type:complete
MCSKNNSDVVSMEEFQSKILDANTFVLDVRTEAEFYGPLGHIEGAMLIPIDELSSRISELDDVKNKNIYVVCRSGNRSNVGKNLLRENSFHAINVDGGMLAWKPLDNE